MKAIIVNPTPVRSALQTQAKRCGDPWKRKDLSVVEFLRRSVTGDDFFSFYFFSRVKYRRTQLVGVSSRVRLYHSWYRIMHNTAA